MCRMDSNLGSSSIKSTRIMWAFAILAVFCACRSPKDSTIPAELIGIWKTSAPTYADRHFEITKDSLSFGTGGGKYDSHPILSIEKVIKENKHVYVISYADGGHKSVFSFHFYPANDGMIRIKNQEDLQWTRQRR